MARIPEAEIERLKSEVSVERLVESRGNLCWRQALVVCQFNCLSMRLRQIAECLADHRP